MQEVSASLNNSVAKYLNCKQNFRFRYFLWWQEVLFIPVVWFPHSNWGIQHVAVCFRHSHNFAWDLRQSLPLAAVLMMVKYVNDAIVFLQQPGIIAAYIW